MKRILTFILVFLLVFTVIGCTEETTTEGTTSTTTLATTTTSEPLEPSTVMVPNGAPALAQLFMQDNDNYIVDVVNGADPLAAAFGSGSHDFIYAPTNLGAKLYNSGIEYQLIAAVTFGNYYLVSMDETFTLASLEGKEIVVFGQNSTSDIILQYVLDENGINATYRYVNAVSDAHAEFILDNETIILSAEPLLSVLAQSVSGFNTIDLQAAYEAITGESSYPQAGVFASAELSDAEIQRFLTDLEESIQIVQTDLNAAVTKAGELEYPFPAPVLTTAIPNSNIDFVTATDVKDDLEAYFNIILEMNATLLGGTLPDTDFYY